MENVTKLKAKETFLKTVKELRYALYLTTHPAKGFWEIKQEGEGSLLTAMIIFGFTIFVMILSNLYTGFIFSGGRSLGYSYVDTIFSMSALFFGWGVANWCLTCLFDGEGKLFEIIKATGYALLPFAIIQLLMVFLSNYFIQREAVFYNMLGSISFAWMVLLMIMSVMITHQYGVLKTILVCIFTLATMALLGFIVLLFFNLLQQVISFIEVYASEISIRMAGG